jgi:hypothetical protein
MNIFLMSMIQFCVDGLAKTGCGHNKGRKLVASQQREIIVTSGVVVWWCYFNSRRAALAEKQLLNRLPHEQNTYFSLGHSELILLLLMTPLKYLTKV